jgi:hypothetical protein
VSEGRQPEIVLNEFGELSRRARRELVEQGIDPDTAVIEHIRTQSIPVIVTVQEPVISAGVEHEAPALAPLPMPVVDEEPVSSVQDSPVFSPALSRRDMRNLRERSALSAEPTEPTEFPADNVVFQVIPVVEADDVDVQPPQTIAGSTSSRRQTMHRDEVVIDHREDASEITEDYEPFSFSTTSTQSTGIIPTTGSALILPMLPEHAPGALSSFNHTGEIYMTGSITLPSSIGQYGADILRMDTSEVDIISDDNDEDVSSHHDLAPVRASSAVSAYSTSNTVVTVPSKFRDRLPLVLAITAAGLAVLVVALFISGYVLGVF